MAKARKSPKEKPAGLVAECALGRLIVLGKMIERLGDDQDQEILDHLDGDDLINLGSMIREYAGTALADVEDLHLDQHLGIVREVING